MTAKLHPRHGGPADARNLLETIAPRASKREKRKPMLAYLVHLDPPWEGVRHMLVTARTLDDAVANTIDAPWAKDRQLGLGCVIYDHTWTTFMRKDFSRSCCYCGGMQLLAACDESREFARMLMEHCKHNRRKDLGPIGECEITIGGVKWKS